jgi:hypothetical protein
MARFLIDSLGPGQAVERALATASWYENRVERRYWERVADAVRRLRGS